MKLATWNINSIRARKERLLGWLGAAGPDIVCLQETKVPDEDFPVADLEAAGYVSACHGQKSYNGVAILSREPLVDVARGLADGVDEPEARLIAATTFGVRVINVYVPNGQAPGTERYLGKLEWMARLRQYLDRRADLAAPLVLCGDFNVAPEDRDVYDPARWVGEIMCSEPERRALGAIVGTGLSDAFRLHHQEGGHFTWWDYRLQGFPRNRGLRIDHVYLSAPLAPRCVAAEIDRAERAGKNPSDHAPVVVTLAG